MRFHCIVFITLCLSWSSVEAADYNYPYLDPYLATATTAILNDDGITPRLKSQIVHVPGLPDRNQLPSLEGRGELSVALYRQNHPAPLLFILPGVGSNPYFGVATYLARLFYQEGSHIVIFPSPMSWNFALSASRSGAPGYAPADARDLYEAMQKSLSVLRDRYNVKITGINFMGVSLGALEGAYLSVLDAEERKIGIEKYLLVNPPLDLYYALKKVDEWHALQNKFGRDKSKEIVAKAIGIVESFPKIAGMTQRSLTDWQRTSPVSRQKSSSFSLLRICKLSFPNSSMSRKSFTTKGSYNCQRPGQKTTPRSARFDVHGLQRKIGLPLWRIQEGEPQADLGSFIKRGSLAPILDRLRSNSKVHIMHNADDFLADKKSIEDLKEALGDQVTLYPYGGHLGNLWFPENKEYALRLFKTVP